MRVACFSVATMDFYPQQGRHFPGGNALNQAVWFASMGIESLLIAAVGDDALGDELVEGLGRAAVDTKRVARMHGTTATNEITNDAEGERYGTPGKWVGGVYPGFLLTEEDWQIASECDVWATHIDGPNFSQAVDRKGERRILTVDCLHHPPGVLSGSGVDKVDVAYFGGTPDMAPALHKLSEQVPGVFVLTLGRLGSLAFHRGTTFCQEALPLEKVVDATGCGDAFQAGFSSVYLATSDIRTALQKGAELGRHAAQRYGGAPIPIA